MDPITFITAVQSLGAWLEAPMKFFSFLGSEDFFLLFLPLVYWAVDTSLGIQIGFILLAGTGLNQYFKMALHGPRPYWLDTAVRGLASETSFGVPSGHAQIATGLWGMLAYYYRKPWVWVSAIFLIFFIGFSRMYLGVHFLHDVLFGWILGALTLWSFTQYWDAVKERVTCMGMWKQIGLAFAVTLVMVLIGVLINALSQGFVIPAEWIANATRDGNELLEPFHDSMQGILTAAGTLFGLCIGLAWITPRGGFTADGPVWKRAVRFIIGLIGVIIFYAGLKAVFPEGDGLVPYTFRYIRYTLVGFWVSGLGPWVFAKLNLTERQ